MENGFLIALFFCIGFFCESIFGFGGALIAYALLGFFMDIEEMIITGLYISTISSLYIAFTSRKYINLFLLEKLVPTALFGTSIGSIIFGHGDSNLLAFLLALILFFLGFKILYQNHLNKIKTKSSKFITFFKNDKIPNISKNKFLIIGALAQGAYGTGGPFVVNALQDDFKSKSEVRANMAIYFLACNILRILYIMSINKMPYQFIINISWTIIPVLIAIYLGHFIHQKINDQYYKKGIAIITIIAGTNFIIKSLS